MKHEAGTRIRDESRAAAHRIILRPCVPTVFSICRRLRFPNRQTA